MRPDSYKVIGSDGGNVMVRPGSRDALKKVDAVVFDCDGTLIDVRESYDATIMRTVRTMVEGFSAVSLPIEEVGGQMILKIRGTGGFNSDWDTTYALSLLSEVAIEQCPRAETGAAGVDRILTRLRELVADFSSKKRLEGNRSIDLYLSSRPGLESDRLREFRKFLGFPGSATQSPMARTFDQIYYGGELYREVYGVRPAVWYDEGLIDRETLFISREDLIRFRKIIGGKKTMAIATGRPFVAVKHTLGSLLSYFERDASVYIGDAEIYPELASEMAKYRKPSGASLVRAHRKLSANVMLYIGDSAEDRLMVDDARKRYGEILFAGICGSSFSEGAQISYFAGTDSDLLVSSVNQIPPALEMMRRS
jgi:phosphoglycolate phosphatase-like HAD superfamily hydrolase